MTLADLERDLRLVALRPNISAVYGGVEHGWKVSIVDMDRDGVHGFDCGAPDLLAAITAAVAEFRERLRVELGRQQQQQANT